jgi:hypothetical protein
MMNNDVLCLSLLIREQRGELRYCSQHQIILDVIHVTLSHERNEI